MLEPQNVVAMTEEEIKKSLENYHIQNKELDDEINSINEIINNIHNICIKELPTILKIDIVNFLIDKYNDKSCDEYFLMQGGMRLKDLEKINESFVFTDYESWKNKKEKDIQNIKELKEQREKENQETTDKNKIFHKNFENILKKYPELTKEQTFNYLYKNSTSFNTKKFDIKKLNKKDIFDECLDEFETKKDFNDIIEEKKLEREKEIEIEIEEKITNRKYRK
jgi:hypothetical protein